MFPKTPFRISFFILCYLVPLALILFYPPYSKQKDQRKKKDHIALLMTKAQELGLAWTTGRHIKAKALSCPDLFHEWPLPPEILKCNPLFLKCLFRGNHSFEFEQKGLPYKIISKSQINFLAPDYALEVWIKIENEKRKVWLEDTCSSIYLPQRIYGYGKRPKKGKDFFWDNFGFHWFIDRRQVTVREVLEWLEQTGQRALREDSLSRSLQDHYRPATGLYPDEMKAYCRFRGKQLAKAHLLDAAFFLPPDLENPLLPPYLRGAYPWRRRRQLQKIIIGTDSCLNILGKECREKLKIVEAFSSSPTWTGVFQALGGVPEFVQNPIRPKRNINISSYYFSAKSRAHAIGERISWNGRSFDPRHFSFKTLPFPEDVERVHVGFRCARKKDKRERF